MRKPNHIFLIFVVGLLVRKMPADAQTDYDYEIIEYPGASLTQVFGINARGNVAGTGHVGSDCVPFIYDSKKATYTDVEPVAGYDCTSLLGISNSGLLVGSVSTDAPNIQSAVVLDMEGNATVFDHPGAISATVFRGVNNDGLVTGYWDGDLDEGEGAVNGFIYDSETGTFTPIVPSFATIPQGINSRGDVVGSAVFVTGEPEFTDPCPELQVDSLVREYGWLRTADGALSYFVVNGGQTHARGITNSGAIVGWAVDSIAGTAKSFVTELDGGQCQSINIPEAQLLAVPGNTLTTGQGIRNSGQIVGNLLDVPVAFIATPQ